MTEQEKRDELFRDRGVRCRQPTQLTLPTGETVMINCGDILTSRETEDMSANARRHLNQYTVRYNRDKVATMGELDLVDLIGGEEVFQTLPPY
jgi:hypothetical protein